MTGIVGPNGCGKSNLVEALRWVMGETSAKRMRGSGMDDVIFGGTGARPARNLAEVTLSVDNSDRLAPAAFNKDDDLEIVRRIEREKGSLYRINGREVRARDVQLLFADAASGAQSPAIVGQGRIGAIINAKPSERRALLEEAAGISGLHSRRHEAELRLKAAETNLERLDDVIGTLETQLQGLKRQARQATRYRNIADQLRRSEAVLFHIDAEAAKGRVAQARGDLAAIQGKVAELTELAATAATRQSEAAAALPSLRQGEAEAAAALQRLLSERDSLDRQKAEIEAAQRQAGERLAQLDADLARSGALAEDAVEAETRLGEERQRLEQAAAGEGAAREERQQLRDGQAAEVARLEGEHAAAAKAIAEGEAQGRAVERRVQELGQRLARLREQLERVGRERGEAEANSAFAAEVEAAETAVGEAERALETARRELELAEAATQAAQQAEAEAREEMQQRDRALHTLDAEIQALDKLLQRPSGDLWPPLLDSVTVSSGYEAALGAALGEDLEVPADEAAPVHWLTLPPFREARPLPAGARPLSELVEAPAVLARALSQVGVVESEAAGARLQPDLGPGQRLVTKGGALWRWDGYVAAAGAPTAAAQRLEQRNRLAELRRERAQVAGPVEAARTAMAEAKAESEARVAAERATRERQRSAFAALDRARAEAGRLAARQAAAEQRLAALAESAERVAGEVAEAEAALAAAEADRAALPDLAEAQARVHELRAALAERRAALTSAEADLQRLAREAETRQERLLAIGRESASWRRRIEETERHQAELAERRQRLQAELAGLAERPAEITARRGALSEQIERAEAARKQAADGLALGEAAQGETDRALRVAEQELGKARELMVRAEGGVEQTEQALKALAQQVAQQLEVRLEGLLRLAEVAPDQELPSRPEVESRVQRLIREREAIGPVNLRAETEAQEIGERIDGLNTERADLIAAIGRLRQAIGSLNREGRERLLAAFELVNKHFGVLFERLFGGGRAHLTLTESDDPLDAGLEIMASPPGKKLQVLSLLSGGEQTLTAIALLFAVFMTNPAPVCVLDEVDAPLDDANVDRFCSLVEELAHSLSTRFLVITHHRLTMARMDRLFGVTMAERGVSQLVSVDLERAAALRETA